MVATTGTALLAALASVVAAQTVDIYLPEYGRYEDLLVAESVGENAGVTTYLIGCGPQTVGTTYCVDYRTGVARDDSPPLCTGSEPYNTNTEDSCVLTAGATLLEGPSTIVFIAPGDDGYSADCSAAGTVSAVCHVTLTDLASFTNDVLTETVSGTEYSFYHVPLTTGMTANGPLPTLKAGGQASTTSIAPSTSSATSPSTQSATSTATPSTSTTPSTSATPSTSTTSSSVIQSAGSSVGSSSIAAASSGTSGSSNGTTVNTTTPATNGSSITTASPPFITQTGSGASVLTQWIMGAAAAAVVAVAATL